jgi:hypothetical protein
VRIWTQCTRPLRAQTSKLASQRKIFMLSAYGETPWQYREIVDPYLGDLESTRSCIRQSQICIGNLMTSLFPSPYSSEQNPQSNP